MFSLTSKRGAVLLAMYYLLSEKSKVLLAMFSLSSERSTVLLAMFSGLQIQEFRQGEGIQARLPENDSDNVFFSPQLIIQFCSGLSMVHLKKTLKLPRFQRGSNIFQWGSNIFQGGGGSNFFQGGRLNAYLFISP